MTHLNNYDEGTCLHCFKGINRPCALILGDPYLVNFKRTVFLMKIMVYLIMTSSLDNTSTFLELIDDKGSDKSHFLGGADKLVTRKTINYFHFIY